MWILVLHVRGRSNPLKVCAVALESWEWKAAITSVQCITTWCVKELYVQTLMFINITHTTWKYSSVKWKFVIAEKTTYRNRSEEVQRIVAGVIFRVGPKMTEHDEVFLIHVSQVSPAVTQGHKLGSTCWWSLCTACRGRGVNCEESSVCCTHSWSRRKKTDTLAYRPFNSRYDTGF